MLCTQKIFSETLNIKFNSFCTYAKEVFCGKFIFVVSFLFVLHVREHKIRK